MESIMKIIRTSVNQGKYFAEETVEMGNIGSNTENAVINVFDEVQFQEILGFGGAFTESAAYNYSLMDSATKDAFMKAYFTKDNGIGYNFGRTHINSCDFSLDIYSYVEEGDKTLETFDISRDKKYIIPFVKDALKYSNNEIFLFASPWSPPAYMKDNGKVTNGGKLLEEYKHIWALYYAKYIKAFLAEGIEIAAISVQNEPIAYQHWESCFYSADDERDLIENHLIPVFEEEGLSHIKIMIWDHNKERVYDRARDILKSEKVNERVWAVAHHWYSGDHFEGVNLVNQVLKKPTITGEFCMSIKDDPLNVAERYVKEIAEDLNNGNIAMCDWNLMLSTDGGPYHNRTNTSVAIPGIIHEDKEGGCAAPILFDQKKKEMVLTPCYYYIGHFSKYIQKGAKRLGYSKYTADLTATAFLNPNGEKVLVICNTGDKSMPVIVRNNNVCTRTDAEPHSIMTVIF